MIIPRCDKCGGLEFNVISTDPNPPTTYALASEYFKGLGLPQTSDLVLRYRNYKATCKKCGAVYRYTTPY